MSSKSPLAASAEQRDGLRRLAVSANRAEADRARAILLSLSGWKSAAIGEVFGVREDTVRDWRSTFMREGLAGIKRHPAPGCPPVKALAALAVASELFAAPVENRINWTLPRLSEEIEQHTGHRISHSRLSVVLRKKGVSPATPRHTLKGRQDAEAVERSGLRLQLMKQQALAGDIVLLFADESEANSNTMSPAALAASSTEDAGRIAPRPRRLPTFSVWRGRLQAKPLFYATPPRAANAKCDARYAARFPPIGAARSS